MTPDDFPLLSRYAKNYNRFIAAITIITEGLQANSIRNVDFNLAKDILSRTVYDAWNAHVSERFFWAGKYQELPEKIQELYHHISMLGLYSVISTNRKVIKSKAYGESVDAMREVIDQALPLAEAVTQLKPLVIKGRSPNKNPTKPANPNKIIKTCPCCFRMIAVVRGTMAHHGYERPGTGWQTASCPGIRFKPLEVSSEGLVWIIGVVRDRLEKFRKSYDERNEWEKISQLNKNKVITVVKGSDQWDKVFRHHILKLESDIQISQSELKRLEERLQNWQPEIKK